MSMYTLMRTMGRPIGRAPLMEQIDATNVSLHSLSQHYYDLYFIIKVSIYKTERVLRFNQLPIEVQISQNTIQQYLDSQTGKTIKGLSSELPVHVTGEVYAYDVGSYDFDYKAVNLEYHPDAVLSNEDKPDLLLSLKDANYDYVCNHSLVSINGFFHYFTKTENGWLIKDGNVTKRKQGDKSHLSVVDFTQIGQVEMIPIAERMIQPATENSPLSDNVYINIGKDVSSKTVGYVLGGYFHLLDNTYKRINNQTIKIDFNQIRWESLYYMMRKNIGVKSLPITDFGDDRVLGFELYHDDTIKALFKLSQSFIVLIDNPNVSIEEYPIGHTGIPKRYETALKPIYPLRIAEGRYPSYKAIKEFNKWTIAVEDNIVPLQVRYMKERNEFNMLHDRIYPVYGELYATANFVRIFADRDLKLRIIDDYFDALVRDGEELRPFITLDNIPYRRSTQAEYYVPGKIIEFDPEGSYFQTIYPDFPFTVK